MMPPFRTSRGCPLPLGPSITPDGANFALLCRHGRSVTLVILPEAGGITPLAELPLDARINRTGDHWHIRVHDLPEAFCYGWRVDGPHGPRTRFDPSRLLLDPAAAILSCGRPVLVVPDGRDRLEASRVVVAWKEAREARRVVRDALPFLQEAKAVMIVEVCEPGTDARAQQQIDDVATYLQRHKVDVEAKAYLHTERTVAQELLRFAGDARADLVVAGGYGHSRLGELILGGVTRSLLADSAVCCMFSH